MSYLLDTDTASAYLRGDARVFNRAIQYGGRLQVSIVTVAELYAWVYASPVPAKRQTGVLNMLSFVTLLPLNHETARKSGELRCLLRRQGRTISTPDALIAATAVLSGLIVVTHNQRHFQAVPELRLDDWLAV